MFRCKLFGHKLYVYAKPEERPGARWVKCSRCNSDFFLDDDLGIFIPLGFFIEDRYSWIWLTT